MGGTLVLWLLYRRHLDEFIGENYYQVLGMWNHEDASQTSKRSRRKWLMSC